MSDFWQLPDKGIHVLSQYICDHVTKSKFAHAPTTETIKIMVLQHAVKYHEARDWIRQQDQSQLTYQALLSHCKMLEAWCEQYQKTKERGHANLASITTTTSSLHLDAITKFKICCNKCRYSHPNGKCPAKVSNAMHVEAITTTQCYASKGNAGKTTSSAEALSLTNAVSAMDVTPAAPHIGKGT